LADWARVKPPPFEYVAPATLEETLDVLAEHGDEAKLIAGGQSLVPMLALRLARPSVLVDLQHVDGLDELSLEDGTLTIGAMTRQRAVERLPTLARRCGMVADAVGLIGHTTIRNRGTVGGSLAHADPAAEWTALAVALNAELDITGPAGSRTVPATDFFVTYLTTAIEPAEVLTRIRLHLPGGTCGSCFTEIARRHGDFALAGVGALLALDGNEMITDVRVALIGVGDRAVRATSGEDVLRGERPDAAVFARAARAVASDIEPRDDVHATASDRRDLARVLVERALRTALDRAREGGADAGA
jgi:carbon-monoxide dehydrogenase medium subunit